MYSSGNNTGQLGAGAGYFAAPAVRPETIRRWKSTTMITSGTVISTPAAIWLPNGVSNWVAPENLEIATVAVAISGLLVIVRAMRNSFHAAMKVMIAVVNIPGAASGRMIFRN